MVKIIIIFLLFLPMIVIIGCEEEPVNVHGPTEASLIGYHQCTRAMDNGPDKGFVLKLEASDDTVKVFNLPDSLFETHRFYLPPEVFSGYRATYLFPDSISDNYRLKISYDKCERLPLEDSIVCTHDIWTAPYEQETEYTIEVKKVLDILKN